MFDKFWERTEEVIRDVIPLDGNEEDDGESPSKKAISTMERTTFCQHFSMFLKDYDKALSKVRIHFPFFFSFWFFHSCWECV